MKKFIVLLIMLAGFFTADVNAQSCCTSKKKCKPVVCCPATPNCCKATKSIDGSSEAKVESSKQEDSSPLRQPKQPVKKEKKLAVVNKVD